MKFQIQEAQTEQNINSLGPKFGGSPFSKTLFGLAAHYTEMKVESPPPTLGLFSLAKLWGEGVLKIAS